jgi:trimethylamine---corrinoid protein Co-methyltransferase
MHQVQRPGAPFIFGACVGPLDMHTMVFPYGTPEWRLNDLLMAEQARFYGLPVFGTAAATDSKRLDAQAGMEYAYSLLVAAMAGTNLIHDLGYMDSGITGSLESIILAAEQVRWVRRFMAGIDVTDETLAVDVIDAVGPGRSFLGEDHTRRHLRQSLWRPYAVDHQNYDRWSERGSEDYATRARSTAASLLARHTPPPLPAAMEDGLRALCGLPAH